MSIGPQAWCDDGGYAEPEMTWDAYDRWMRERGWRGPPLPALAARCRSLGDARLDGPVTLRCGRCRRILHQAWSRWNSRLRVPMADLGWWASHTGATKGRTARRLSDPRPYAARESAADAARTAAAGGERPGMLSRYRVVCHPRRCGAVYTFRVEALTAAYLDAVEAGRTEIAAGTDVG